MRLAGPGGGASGDAGGLPRDRRGELDPRADVYGEPCCAGAPAASQHVECVAHTPDVEKAMARRNLTVQLDEEVVRKARVLAVQRSTSISGLVSAEIERLVGEHDAYLTARSRARDRLQRGLELGGPPYPGRDELYDRA